MELLCLGRLICHAPKTEAPITKRMVATISDRLLLKPKTMSKTTAANKQARPKAGSVTVSNLLMSSNKRDYRQYGLWSSRSLSSLRI